MAEPPPGLTRTRWLLRGGVLETLARTGRSLSSSSDGGRAGQETAQGPSQGFGRAHQIKLGAVDASIYPNHNPDRPPRPRRS